MNNDAGSQNPAPNLGRWAKPQHFQHRLRNTAGGAEFRASGRPSGSPETVP